MKRVVVTGLGAVTPLGNDVQTTWQALLAGKSGVGRISHFDATQFTTTIAAEVKDFDPERYMDAKEVKRNDPFIWYAIAAAKEAWVHSGLDQAGLNPERVGVMVGSGIGGIGTIEGQCQAYAEKGSRRISPFFVPMIIGNMAAGQVSIAQHRGHGLCHRYQRHR